MLSRLVAAVAVGVFTVAGLASHATAFSEPIPIKISLLKWGGSPPAGKLYKIVSKAPKTGPLFTLPTGDPVLNGGSVEVKVGAGVLNCTLASGAFAGSQGWKALGNPAGSKGYKYINKNAPTNDPCKIVIIKEKVIKILAKSVGSIALPVDFPPGNPEVSMLLTVDTDEYCALAVKDHFKEKADKLIKMKSQDAPATCARCGDNSNNRLEEECDGTDDSACPGNCVPPGEGGGTCGDDVINGGDECTCAVEQCDGTDADECEGLCLPNCTCPVPVCNNGVKEVGEVCDPAGSTADCPGQVCGGFCKCVDIEACNCGTPDPTMYMFTDKAPTPGSVCGSADGVSLTELECMGLYIGGGGGALPVPSLVPDESTPKFNIAQCVGTDLTLAPTSPAQVGPRHCTEGKRCVGGDNDGDPCIRDKQCPLGLCEPQCWFTSYLNILNLALPLISTCISIEMVEDTTGGVNCETGETLTRMPIDAVVHLTLGDQSSSTPGYNPCPVCVGGTLNVADSGTCEGGPNSGLSCMPMTTVYDLNDCCAGGLNNSKPCTDNTDCPGSTCIPGCTTNPTSLDCPPQPLTELGPGLLLTLNLNTEDVDAYRNTAVADANGNFCGWCRDVEVEGSGCFEGHPDEGPPGGANACPDSAVIECRPATFWGPGGGDPADMTDCRDGLTCRTDADCTAPYETCTQRNPGAFRDATARTLVYNAASRPGDLRDGLAHPSTTVTNFCLPPNFDDTIDGDADQGGPGAVSLVVEARLSPSGAFTDVGTGILD